MNKLVPEKEIREIISKKKKKIEEKKDSLRDEFLLIFNRSFVNCVVTKIDISGEKRSNDFSIC